jgi:putative ABC transport system permease protein
MSTGEEEVMADSPFLWGPAMKREYPEVADYARFSAATQSSDPWEIRRDEIAFSESKILYADASVFGIFSWPLKQGDAQTALLIPSLSCSRKAWLANTSVRKIRSAKS